MAETFPNPTLLSTSAADALGGTTHERTQIAILAEGVDPSSSPTLNQQYNRIQHAILRALSGIARLQCVKTATLEVGVFPGHYRKSDGTAVLFEGGTIALTASQTNVVYIDHATNLLAKSITGWPADITTFTPIAEYVCGGSDITTDDDDADRRQLTLYHCNSSSTAPTGTTAAAFTVDSDNAGAGVDQQLRFNRGSTDAEDAALEWDETNDRFRFRKQHSTATLAPIDAASIQVGGSDVIDSSGDLVAAAIKATLLYTFGANGATPTGIQLTPAGASGVPAAGAHVAGELHVDSAGVIYICTAAGTPGTWQQVGKQDGDIVLSVTDGSALAGAAASCTIQVKDRYGNNVAGVKVIDVYLEDDTDGAGEAANTSAITVTTGTKLRELTANKIFRAKTDANGSLVFTTVNSIADHVYVLCLPAPGSVQMDCSDHGDLTWT